MATVLRRLIGQSAVYGLAGTLPRIASLVLVPILTRYLVPAEYGIVMLTATIGSLVSALMLFGMDAALTRFYLMPEEHAADREIMVFTLLVTGLASGGLVLLAANLFGPSLFPPMSSSGDFAFSPYVTTVLIGTFAALPLAMTQAFNRARQRPVVYAALQLGQVLLSTSLVLLFVVALRDGAIGKIRGDALAALCMVPVALLILRPHLKPRLSRAWMVRALQFGWPLVPFSVFAWALTFSDRIILERYTSLTAVGIYSLAYSLAMTVMIVTGSLNMAWSPMYYELAEAGDYAAIRRAITAMAVISSAVCLTLALFSREVVVVLSDPAYSEAARYMPILVGAYYLQSVYYVTCTPIFFALKTRVVPVLSGLAAVSNVAINLLLVPHYGVAVAAWATVISYCIMAAGAWLMSYRLQPDAFQHKKLLRLVAVTGLGLLAALLLRDMGAFEPNALAVKLVVVVAVGCAIVAVGVITPHELRSVATHLAGRRS